MPFLTISRFSLAFSSSSSAFWRSVRPCSNSSSETTPLSCSGFRAAEFAAGLRQRYFGYRDARFGARKLSHLRDDLHRGDHLALAHHLAGLLVDVGNDTRNLGLDQHLVAGFDLAGGDHELFERVEFGLYDRVDYLYRTGLLPQEHERSEQQRRKEHTQKDFQKFFHSRNLLNLIVILHVLHPQP